MYTMQVKLRDIHNEQRLFKLGSPCPASRRVLFEPQTKASKAFDLPLIRYNALDMGDVRHGGSCNVGTLHYVPHGLTHMETSAHILSANCEPPTAIDIPTEQMTGLMYLIDVSDLPHGPGTQLPWERVESGLKKNTLPISFLAIKTAASLVHDDYDFSGKDFLSVAPETAAGIHDYAFTNPESPAGTTRINCLLLDLPSIDPEKDDGRLISHRAFFGLPETGYDAHDTETRVIVELACFAELEEGYYYACITPSLFQTNAICTGIVVWPMSEVV